MIKFFLPVLFLPLAVIVYRKLIKGNTSVTKVFSVQNEIKITQQIQAQMDENRRFKRLITSRFLLNTPVKPFDYGKIIHIDFAREEKRLTNSIRDQLVRQIFVKISNEQLMNELQQHLFPNLGQASYCRRLTSAKPGPIG